jgi:hypothetical protein
MVLDLYEVNFFKILHFIESIENDTILKYYIDDLKEMRKEGGILKEISKLFVNSFYGRMGMREELINYELIKSEGDKESFSIGDLGEFKIKKKKIIKKIKGNVFMAAAITSKARIKLYKAIMEIEKRGRILYSDTDSVFGAFDKSLEIENKKIGEIYFDTNIETTRVKKSIFISPKMYGLVLENGKEIVKIKGINRSISFDLLKKKFYSNEKLELGSLIFSKKNMKSNIFVQEKKLNLDYDKRI